MGALRKLLVSAVTCLAIWLTGLVWFVAQMPTSAASSVANADAIVVLTGGKGRLEHGLQLLTQGKAKMLFISGVGKDTNIGDLLHQVSPEVRNAATRLPASAITLGKDAENTIGNAEETARWVLKQRPKNIILVTANYHMPRSISEFEELMPQLTIHPAPVLPDDFTLSAWWLSADSRTLVLSEYHKYLASKLRHLLI